MKFEWDDKKRQRNLKKHGIDFADLEPMFFGVTVTILDDRFDYGEDRFVTFGLLNSVVLVVAHTEENDVIRFISARKATRNEEKRYFEEIAD
nr:BrnT family toxin [Nitrosomonas nitrosa]